MHPFCEKLKNDLSIFDLNIHGLEEKTYEYSLELKDDFFLNYDQDIIKGGQADVKIVLEKTVNLLRLHFNIEAKIVLECDRSLELFTEDFSIAEKHIFKFGETNQEISDEMTMITFGTPRLNVADHVFEFIFLSVPAKKIHPDLRAQYDEQDEESLFYEDKIEEEKKTEEKIDPRWADLLKLTNKK